MDSSRCLLCTLAAHQQPTRRHPLLTNVLSSSSPRPLAAPARWECVLHKFDAVQEGELSLAPGAWVQVLDHHDDGWLTVSTANGETGLVPRSYVTSTRLTQPLTQKA